MPSRPLVSLRNVNVAYEDHVVLRDISLDLEEGAFYLLSGPSGGGKSTLINFINGTLSDSASYSGQLLYRGEAMDLDPAQRALHLGSVLQDPDSQIIFATVEDEMAFALENMNLEPEEIGRRIKKYAPALKLDLGAQTSTLSGGQKQRLMTACTLAMGQKVLLFDEPLASLDREGADLVLRTLARLVKEEAYTVVFIEHRIDWVLPWADKFIWLDETLKTFETSQAFNSFFNKMLDKRLRSAQDLPQPEPDESSPLISLRDVRMAWGDRILFDGLNFTLNKGDRIVIQGANGAGKTTLLQILAGLIRPHGGRVDFSFNKKEAFKKIGFVMQNPSYQLFLSTVRDELDFQGDPQAIESLVGLFGFEDILDRHPHSLSEGQKRRLGFAVILSMRPEILFLDEPTVGQDYISMNKMLQALGDFYQDRPLTMISLTHDQRVGSYFGDRVLRLEGGQLKEV